MRSGLVWTLFVLQMVAAAAVLGGSLLVSRAYSLRHFSEYVEARQREHVQMLADEVAQAYAQDGDLAQAAESVRALRHRYHDRDRHSELAAAAPPPEHAGIHPGPMPPLQLQDADGHYLRGDPRTLKEERLREPIEVNGRVVGYLAWPRFPGYPEQQEFARKQAQHIAVIVPVALVVAALFAALITSLIVRPIRALSAGAAALARREFHARVKGDRRDELGELAADFNKLAEALEGFDARQRQWIADIAHELRTPVSVLRGELEAVLDGVRPAGAGLLRSLQQEVDRLTGLIDDLHLVSLAESGGLPLHRTEADVGALVREAAQRFRDRLDSRGLEVQAVVEGGLHAEVDVQRIEQVLANLLENEARHATLGPVVLSARAFGEWIAVSVADAGPGVPAEALARLFDRLFRADSARARASGGSGLGLSICKSIVEAHGGTIEAKPTAAGGLEIVFRVPRLRERPAVQRPGESP